MKNAILSITSQNLPQIPKLHYSKKQKFHKIKTAMINSYWASLAIILSCVSIYAYVKWKFTYWKKQGVPFLEPIFPFGSYELLRRTFSHPSEVTKKHYDHFKALGHKHCGGFLAVRPIYIAIDLEIVKLIMSNDSNNFMDRSMYYNEKDDPLSANLAFMKGDKKWKSMRAKLTPAFSSGKLKMMFQILIPCSDQFVTAIKEQLKTNEIIDITKFADCFSANVLGTCAFGLEGEGFTTEENVFKKNARECLTVLSLGKLLNWVIAYADESLAHFFKICLLPKGPTKFFYKLFHDTVEFRKSTKYSRPDLMQLLINLQNEDQNITMLEIATQAFGFLVIGIETTSSLISFCLYELAQNQYIQKKLREEIEKVTAKDSGQINYDNLFEMKYLNQVIDETIRKYPSVSVPTRRCANDYKIPNSNLILTKGTDCFVSVLALHYDAEYFPDPTKFDPERFNEVNKAKIPPFAYLPFGGGPRICIASRFGMLIVKLAVAVTVKNFKFDLNEASLGTQKFQPFQITLSFLKPILLNMKEL